MQSVRSFLMLSAAVAGLGCASAGRQMFREPVVTLKDVAVNGVGFTGGSVDVVLNVYNPNGFTLDATRMSYTAFIDTTEFGSGVVDSRFTVQEGDSTTVRIPVNFTWAGVGSAARQLFEMGTVNYRVKGDISVATALGNYTIPYDRTGRFTTTGRR